MVRSNLMRTACWNKYSLSDRLMDGERHDPVRSFGLGKFEIGEQGYALLMSILAACVPGGAEDT